MSFSIVVDALERCSQTSGRNAKLAILDGIAHTDTFRTVVLYAKNPMWTYGLTVPEVVAGSLSTVKEDSVVTSVLVELDALHTRTIPANDKTRRAIIRFISRCASELGRKYLCQIVNHELKIGIQDFERWFPGMLAKSPVMLCGKWDGEELKGDWTIEPKFDGYRCAIVVGEDGSVEAISRGNKQFWNWQHIQAAIKDSGVRGAVLDGEFYAGEFGLTSSICKTQKPHARALELKYHVFDMLTIKEWNTLKCNRTLRQRQAALYKTGLVGKYVQFVQGQPLRQAMETRLGEIQARVDEYYLQGYEGAVLKNMDSVYEFDRSDQWLKVKPEEDCDVEVIGAEEGKGRHKGRLGAFIVKGKVTYKKKSYAIVSHVGGGFSDEERDLFWAQHKKGKLVGTIVEVRYQDVTTEVSMGKSCNALRFPRFMRCRDDK